MKKYLVPECSGQGGMTMLGASFTLGVFYQLHAFALTRAIMRGLDSYHLACAGNGVLENLAFESNVSSVEVRNLPFETRLTENMLREYLKTLSRMNIHPETLNAVGWGRSVGA